MLTQEEKDLLLETLSQAIEGHKESKAATELDPSITGYETFVEIMCQHDDYIDKLRNIYVKVQLNKLQYIPRAITY